MVALQHDDGAVQPRDVQAQVVRADLFVSRVGKHLQTENGDGDKELAEVLSSCRLGIYGIFSAVEQISFLRQPLRRRLGFHKSFLPVSPLVNVCCTKRRKITLRKSASVGPSPGITQAHTRFCLLGTLQSVIGVCRRHFTDLFLQRINGAHRWKNPHVPKLSLPPGIYLSSEYPGLSGLDSYARTFWQYRVT